jgi:hypothetical protein
VIYTAPPPHERCSSATSSETMLYRERLTTDPTMFAALNRAQALARSGLEHDSARVDE